MKTIDFTQPGGFPLTQDQLGYLQEAYEECINALAAVGGSGPIVVSGCAITKTFVSGTTYNYTISAGWVFYEGDMIRVGAMAVSGVNESVNAVYMLLTPTSTPLTYNNGSTPNVVNDVSGSLQVNVIGTADSATLFLLSELQPYGREASETHILVSLPSGEGTITGNIYYRKNNLNTTLQIRGSLNTATPSDFPATPGVSTQIMGTLPVGYRPVSQYASFIAPLPTGQNRIKDPAGGYFSSLNGSLAQNGRLTLDFIVPDVSEGSYAVDFNVVVPLD